MKGLLILTVLLACSNERGVVLAQSTQTAGSSCSTQNATSQLTNMTFLFCTNGQWVTVYCLSGSTFDSTSGTCVNTASTAAVSTTTVSPGSLGTVNVTNTSCTGSNNGATFPYQNSNSQFYVCINGQAVLAQCAYNSIYNQATGSCNSNNNNMNPGFYSCPYGTILLPAPNNCQNYISCVNGQGTLKQCPMGLYFSPTMGACTINIPPSCYNTGSNYYPGYYPNSNSNLGTNYGTNSFPIYEASCYPNCNTNSNFNYGQNYQPIYGIA